MTARLGLALTVILSVLAGGAALAGTGGPVRNQVGRIGIGEIGPPGLSVELRIRLEDALAAGLAASGAEVISAAELARARERAGLETCAEPHCEQRLAQLTETHLWLRGTCALDTSTYRLHLELVDAESGTVRAARDDVCDICTESDVAAIANVAASALKASLAGAPAPRSWSAASGAPPPLTPPSGSTSPTTGRPDLAATNGGRSFWRRALPWTALVAAAGAGAAGAYYLRLNDRCTGLTLENTCQYHYDTVWQGVPLLALAAALAATGIILLALPDRPGQATSPPAPGLGRADTSPRIVASFDSIAITGRF